jgi:hypothetical protein
MKYLKLARVNGPSKTLSRRWSRIGKSGLRGMVTLFAFTKRTTPRKYFKRSKKCWEIPRKRIQTSSNACSKQLMIGCKSVMLVRAPNTALTSSFSGKRKTVSGSKTNSWGLGKLTRRKKRATPYADFAGHEEPAKLSRRVYHWIHVKHDAGNRRNFSLPLICDADLFKAKVFVP